MSKDIKNTTEEIMKKIEKRQLKMKPKIYFIAGTIFSGIGLALTISFSIFLTSLIRFYFRSRGGWMAQYKVEQLLLNFPWWTVLFAVLSLLLGIFLIRKYDFSYKIKPWAIIVAFIMIILISAWFVDLLGFNEVLLRRGPGKGMMKRYIQEEVIIFNNLNRRNIGV